MTWNELVKMVKAEQGTLTDREFAERLGMTRTTWSSIKTGKSQGRVELPGAIYRALPHLLNPMGVVWMCEGNGKTRTDN